MDKELRIIISGGGTGGHIFPAVSIANALRQMRPEAKILFVGAEGRMEMQRVPAAGYEIKGLPIKGFDRRHLLKNISVVWHLLKSLRMARHIIKDFRPMVAVGVGGYASGLRSTRAREWAFPASYRSKTPMRASPTSCWPAVPRRSAWPTRGWSASSPPTASS